MGLTDAAKRGIGGAERGDTTERRNEPELEGIGRVGRTKKMARRKPLKFKDAVGRLCGAGLGCGYAYVAYGRVAIA